MMANPGRQRSVGQKTYVWVIGNPTDRKGDKFIPSVRATGLDLVSPLKLS